MNIEAGKIQADLTIGADIVSTIELESNKKVAGMGVKLHGQGFLVEEGDLEDLGYYRREGLKNHIRRYIIGKDIVHFPRGLWVIDLYGLSAEETMHRYPEVYQLLYEKVKPNRDTNRRDTYKNNWWIFGEPRATQRPAFDTITRYIATTRTAKHRLFTFIDSSVIFESLVVGVALDDAFYLGILSSSIHTNFAMKAGGWMGVGNDSIYNHKNCFYPFPFPTPTNAQKQTIRDLAERLDAHRKRQQSLHPKLTMTGMYNVLEKLRSEEPLDDKERKIHERGLVGILRQLHDELDMAVTKAYGWENSLPSDEILQRLVDLNTERAAEEARGLVRWLRPEYQAPEVQGVQSAMELENDDVPVVIVVAEKRRWPKDLTAQVTTLRDLLRENGETPLSVVAIATAFKPKLNANRQTEAAKLLNMMASLGQAELVKGGWRS